MTAVICRIECFDPDADSITFYLERMDLFMQVNDVSEEKIVAVFLSSIGSRTYRVLRYLCLPDKPGVKSYLELKRILTAHFEPKRHVIVERFHFHRRSQAPDESIADFMLELRRLAFHCDFGDFLDEALRDRLVCGLRSMSIQKQLLSEEGLTLKSALEIAQNMELVDKFINAKELKDSETGVQKVSTSHLPQANAECYRCGNAHDPRDCRFQDVNCYFCGRQGHIAAVCRSKKAARCHEQKQQ